MKEFFKKAWPYLLIAALGLICLGWFGKEDFIISVDTLFPIDLSFVDEYFGIWSQRTSFGGADLIKLTILFPFAYTFKLYSLSGLPYNPMIAERVVIYTLFTFAGISAYYLSKKSFPKNSNLSHLVAAVMYMFSFYTMFIFNAMPLFLVFSFSFFPFVLAKYINLLRTKKISDALGLGVLIFLLLTSCYSAPPYIVLHAGIIFLYFVGYCLKNKDQFKPALGVSAITAAVFILLSSFWLYPFIFSERPTIESFRLNNMDVDRTFSLNSSQLVDTLRTQGYFGFRQKYKGEPFYMWFKNYDYPVLGFLSFIPLFIAFYSLFDGKKKDGYGIYLFHAGMVLLFSFFVSAAYLPTYPIFQVIGERVKFFDLFRTSFQRFSWYVVLGVALMSGLNIWIKLITMNTKCQSVNLCLARSHFFTLSSP
jgi:hypothetical protein